jgi:hypothetical protein
MRRLSYGELRARLGLTVSPAHPVSAKSGDHADGIAMISRDDDVLLRHLPVPLPTLGSVDRFE